MSIIQVNCRNEPHADQKIKSISKKEKDLSENLRTSLIMDAALVGALDPHCYNPPRIQRMTLDSVANYTKKSIL